MKKLIYLSLAVSVTLMVSCHTKKKVVETHFMADKTITKKVDSSTVKTKIVAAGVDSSRITRADSSTSTKKERIDVRIHLRSGKSVLFNRDSIGDGTNDYMNNLINRALADADSLHIHIEREQKDSKKSNSTEQKSVKTHTSANQEAKHTAATEIKNDIVKKDKVKNVETKPDYGWIPWVAAIICLLGVCLWIMHKLKV